MEKQNEKHYRDDDSSTSSSSSDSSEEKLSFLSDKFDPLKALYVDKISIDSGKYHLYDNLASFESSLKQSATKKTESYGGAGDKSNTTENVHQRLQQQSSIEQSNVSESCSNMLSERRFLPHQMPLITTETVKKRHVRNLKLKMEEFKGPLAALKKYVEEKKMVKIYTRKQKGIRGYIIGYIIAFDVHWNLLVTDAYEVWRRRKYKFSENNAILGKPTNSSSRLRKLGITLPETKIKSLNRKYVECSRNVNQIMIKGEEVCLIHSLIDEN